MIGCIRHHVGRNTEILLQDVEYAGFIVRRPLPSPDGLERRWLLRRDGGKISINFMPTDDEGYDLVLGFPRPFTKSGRERCKLDREYLLLVLDHSFNIRHEMQVRTTARVRRRRPSEPVIKRQ
ncbi:MAG: hypothetical protein PF961_19400 [Planctomycetota bacterium]|jgi:hypothetical protein|nr:hypothetical protein [Planctomycetota bacterium]